MVDESPRHPPLPVAGSPGEPESPVEQVVRKTPWWAISFGLHAVGALILGWMIVLTPPPAEAGPFIVKLPPQPATPTVIVEDDDPHPDIPIPVPDKANEPLFSMEHDLRNESKDFEPDRKLKGDVDALADNPFKGKGNIDVIGPGRTGGGRKGGPLGGRDDLRKGGRRGNTPKTNEAVFSALLWLARHQNPDGSWGVQSHLSRCKGEGCSPNPPSASADFDPGVTGLSVLAFLGAGYSHLSQDVYGGIRFGDVVRKGLQWMTGHQDIDGFIGSRAAHKAMYNHAICTLALCEGYGLTFSDIFKENAQRALDCLVASQNPGKGWRYAPRCGDSDTSVTGWAVMALKSAEISGLGFPRSAYDGTRAWLNEVTEESYGRAGYTFRGTGKVFCAHNESFDHQEALTAIAVMARIFIDRNPSDANVRNGAHLLMRDLPAWSGPKIDFYAWYYEALALFQFDGPTGPLWSKWNRSMVEALVKPQNPPSSGCKHGSWEPVDRWSCEGGRVYATAINALTLEVYYRYDRVFTGKDRKEM